MAAFCSDKGVSEDVFNHGLEIIIKKRNKAALHKPNGEPYPLNTPPLHIDRAKLGWRGIHMKRVETTHYLNLFIGLAVNCCNHINGGATAEMAVQQCQNPNSSLYVIFDHKKPRRWQNNRLDEPRR